MLQDDDNFSYPVCRNNNNNWQRRVREDKKVHRGRVTVTNFFVQPCSKSVLEPLPLHLQVNDFIKEFERKFHMTIAFWNNLLLFSIKCGTKRTFSRFLICTYKFTWHQTHKSAKFTLLNMNIHTHKICNILIKKYQ